jgi:outer membrane lipoprotein carrier protein
VAGAEVAKAIQQKYESLDSFRADFKQQLKNAASGEIEEREGSIAYEKPGLIRWETVRPEPEVLVVGQEAVWNYFPKDELAIKSPVEQVLGSKTMLRFISGKARLDEDFWIEDEGREAGLLKLGLTPKNPEPSLVRATVWVDPETYLLRSILLIDFYGNANKLGLDNLVLDPKLPSGLFSFTPPEGVEVEDNTVSPGQPTS